MAVVKLDLSGMKLESGKTYAVSFHATAKEGEALIVHLPEVKSVGEKESRMEWIPLTDKPRPLRFVFQFDPQINEGEVSFFFDKETLARGGQFILGDFRFTMFDE